LHGELLHAVERPCAVGTLVGSARDLAPSGGSRKIRRRLGNLRGALGAQVAAGALDADLLRERLAALDASLQRFRQRVEPPPAG